MPKKPPKSPFYFFMIDFKEEQRKKGVIYANMIEVSQAAGPSWTSAESGVRAKFEAIAKAEKAKANVPENKFFSTGLSLAELEASERELREAEEAEKKDIINFVKQKNVDKNLLDEDIFVMDVNSYCKARGSWVVGEFTLLRCTLRHGVKDSYHKLLSPAIPYAYNLDMKYGSKEFGLPMPDEMTCTRNDEYIQIFANILDYLRKRDDAPNSHELEKSLPRIYTLPEKVPECYDFLMQLRNRAAQNDIHFRVYQLQTLFYWLVYHLSQPYGRDERFSKESQALTALQKDITFKYSPGLACEMHHEADKSLACSSNRATSWAFTVFEITCALLGLPPCLGRHVPMDYQPDHHNENREDYTTPRFASYDEGVHSHCKVRFPCHDADASADAPPTQCSAEKATSSIDRDLSRNASSSTPPAEGKRTYAPLRMPKINYATSNRAAPGHTAQGRTFPPPPARGRGRGLADIFKQTKL